MTGSEVDWHAICGNMGKDGVKEEAEGGSEERGRLVSNKLKCEVVREED